MELSILTLLDFNLNIPLETDFLQRILILLNINNLFVINFSMFMC